MDQPEAVTSRFQLKHFFNLLMSLTEVRCTVTKMLTIFMQLLHQINHLIVRYFYNLESGASIFNSLNHQNYYFPDSNMSNSYKAITNAILWSIFLFGVCFVCLDRNKTWSKYVCIYLYVNDNFIIYRKKKDFPPPSLPFPFTCIGVSSHY